MGLSETRFQSTTAVARIRREPGRPSDRGAAPGELYPTPITNPSLNPHEKLLGFPIRNALSLGELYAILRAFSTPF